MKAHASFVVVLSLENNKTKERKKNETKKKIVLCNLIAFLSLNDFKGSWGFRKAYPRVIQQESVSNELNLIQTSNEIKQTNREEENFLACIRGNFVIDSNKEGRRRHRTTQ